MKSKQRLGRGLGALLPDKNGSGTGDNGNGASEKLFEIPVDKIEANPFQPRLEFDRTALEELKQSIQSKGIIQPISVRKMNNGTFQLVAGERRLRAVKELNIPKVPAYVLDISSDEDMLEIALIENVQREFLNPIEMAWGYQRLIDECKLTQEKVAQKIGKDRTTITNLLRLLKLPDAIQNSLQKGEITVGHARALLALPDTKNMIKLWKKTTAQKFSVRQVEKTVKSLLKELNDNAATGRNDLRKNNKHVFIKKFESTLQEKFGTKVKIRTKKDGGSIEIQYYSREDLDRLMEIFDEIKTF